MKNARRVSPFIAGATIIALLLYSSLSEAQRKTYTPQLEPTEVTNSDSSINITYNADGSVGIAANTTGIYNSVTTNAVVIPGLINGSVVFGNATGGLSQDNAGLFFDPISNSLGIGTTTPRTSLDIVGGDTGGLMLRMKDGVQDVAALQTTDYFTGPGRNYYLMRKARGTSTSPTAVSQNDYIGGIFFHGYDGASFRPLAGLSSYVTAAPGVNDMPGTLYFTTSSDGTYSNTERLRIDHNGNMGFGQTTFGTSAAKTFAIGNTTAAPSTSPADAVQIWAADYNGVGGQNVLKIRDEMGSTIQFRAQAAITNVTGGAVVDAEARAALNALLNALQNIGLLNTP